MSDTRPRLVRASLVVVLAAGLMLPAMAAQAATETISGYTTAKTQATATKYNVVRKTTRTAVELNPSNLLVQNNVPFVHQLYYAVINEDGSTLSTFRYFGGTGSYGTIISGIPVGKKFRASAYGYNSTIGDDYFAGTLKF